MNQLPAYLARRLKEAPNLIVPNYKRGRYEVGRRIKEKRK